ncbi:MAG: hypothetical protein ACUVWX_13900, partial [Kiritimatiellia bacterium]
MQSGKKFSKTMRIDLIPDLSQEVAEGKKARILISPSLLEAGEGRKPEKFKGGTNYQQLLQSLYDAALVCDMAGTMVDVNARA